MALSVQPATSGGGGFTSALRMGSPGDRLGEALLQITFDSSYPTGGEAVSFATYFPGGVFSVSIPSNPTYNFVWDSVNGKIIVYTRSNDTEVSNATDLSAQVVYATVKGLK